MIILTCNVRTAGAADGANSWEYRKDLCAEVIRSRSPDIVCFQEMQLRQFVDLSAALPGHASYALVDEPTGRDPLNSIFYRADGFARISAGGFWLSETPHVAGSKSWDSDCVRLANWVRLEDRATEAEFRVVNTHIDHIGQAARENQARLIVEDAAAYPAEYPQILTGDMNCDSRNRAIHVFKEGGWSDTYARVHGTEDPGYTFHKFLGPEYGGADGKGKMDWIFTRGDIEVTGAEVIKDSAGKRFPSDHYFVSATVTVRRQGRE